MRRLIQIKKPVKLNLRLYCAKKTNGDGSIVGKNISKWFHFLNPFDTFGELTSKWI